MSVPATGGAAATIATPGMPAKKHAVEAAISVLPMDPEAFRPDLSSFVTPPEEADGEGADDGSSTANSQAAEAEQNEENAGLDPAELDRKVGENVVRLRQDVERLILALPSGEYSKAQKLWLLQRVSFYTPGQGKGLIRELAEDEVEGVRLGAVGLVVYFGPDATVDEVWEHVLSEYKADRGTWWWWDDVSKPKITGLNGKSIGDRQVDAALKAAEERVPKVQQFREDLQAGAEFAMEFVPGKAAYDLIDGMGENDPAKVAVASMDLGGSQFIIYAGMLAEVVKQVGNKHTLRAVTDRAGNIITEVTEKAAEVVRTRTDRLAATGLPGTTAESVGDKLKRYLLNLEHPVGGDKAKWFRDALGFTQANLNELAEQIKFDPLTAVQTTVTEHGTKYNQVIDILGANGKRIPVTFAWIKNRDGVIRLVSGIPTNK